MRSEANWLAVAAMLAIAANAAAAAPREPLLAATITAQDQLNLYSVHGAELKLKKSLPVGKSAGRMCSDGAGATLYVAVDKGVAVIDLQAETVAATLTDPAFKSPYGCVVSPDARKLYVTDREANLVFVFSLPTRQLLKKISVPDDPRHGIFTPGNKSIVFSCGDASALAVVDPATDSVVRTLKTVGLDPRSMLITPDGKYLVVALVSSDILSWFHVDTLEPLNSFGVTRSPQGVVVAADGDRIYVSSAYEGVIGVVNLREHKADGTPEPRQVSTIPVGQGYSLAISPDGNYLYAAPGDGVGVIVDLRSWKILKPAMLRGATNVLYLP